MEGTHLHYACYICKLGCFHIYLYLIAMKLILLHSLFHKIFCKFACFYFV